MSCRLVLDVIVYGQIITCHVIGIIDITENYWENIVRP